MPATDSNRRGRPEAARDRPSPPRPIGRWRALLPAIAYAGLLVALCDPPRATGNVWSRYLTIESIVERGTLSLDDAPYRAPSGTPDLVKFRGSFYSDKPPVLSALGAVVYAPLHRAGWSLFDLRSPEAFMRSLSTVNRVLVGLLVAVPCGLALYALRRLLQYVAIGRTLSDLLVVGFGCSSLLLSYGVTFNNHSVAAGLLTASFALVAMPAGGRGPWRSALAGVLAALSATIDLPAGGCLWAALLAWSARQSRGRAIAFALGSIAPAAAHLVLQSRVTGSPMPVEMYPEAFDFEGSYWASDRGTFRDDRGRGWFFLELLVGPQGWLTVTPVLLLAVPGFFFAIRRRDDFVRTGAFVVAGTVAVLLGYYSLGVRRTDFAGQSFGVRHLLPITPMAFFYAASSMEWLRRGAWRLVVLALMAVGAVYAWAGMADPWSRIEGRQDIALRIAQRFVLYPVSSYDR